MLKSLIPLALLPLLASPAFAQEAVPNIHIRVADLDLRQHADVAKLDRRIDSAAEKLCSTAPLTTASKITALRCRTAVRDSAKPQRDQLVAVANGNMLASARPN